MRIPGLRRFQFALPIVLILSIFSMLPALAADDSTLIEVNDSSTGVLGDPKTDGEYVVWAFDSTSVHSFCKSVWTSRVDNPDPVFVTTISQSSSYAVDEGLLLVETPATRCQDNSGDQLTPGMFLIDLETLESRTLFDDVDDVTDLAIDYPYVAWITREDTDASAEQMVWALDIATPTSTPIQIDADEVSAESETYLFLEDGTVYWIETRGSSGVGSAARSPIGGSTTYFMSMHDTTEVALAGQYLVTVTEGRPLFHDLSNGGTRWLDDFETSDVSTDGRFVYWSRNNDDGRVLFAFDPLTNARFKVWSAPFDDPDNAGYVTDVHADNGAVVWIRRYYNIWQTAVHGSAIADRLPSTFQPDPGASSPDWTYYPESGHYLANDFRDFWNDDGGLPVFGYPLTEEFDQLSPETGNAYSAQMTERQRFEWHPENVGTPYAVLLGRLGETILLQQGRDWNTFEQADPSAEHYLAATGHAIAPEFWNYWSTHGLDLGHTGVSFDESLALFGYPLSEPMMETNADGDTVLTQYFERAVFEFHSDNPASSQILLRRLGAELLEAWGW